MAKKNEGAEVAEKVGAEALMVYHRAPNGVVTPARNEPYSVEKHGKDFRKYAEEYAEKRQKSGKGEYFVEKVK